MALNRWARTGNNYNPFELKSNLRSVNVCFDGQETNFQVTGPELTACIQKCLQRTRSRTKVLSGKGREKNATRPYFPKTEFSKQEKTQMFMLDLKRK